jgi:site-specific recombinase XerD
MWVMSGVDLVTVKNWLGHASIQQTMVYAKVSPQHGHEAMRRFGEWAAARLR